MSKDRQIIANLTKAGVPRACWSVSVTNTGRAVLRNFAQAVKERETSREAVLVAYVKHATDLSLRYLACELIAKELVLAGIPTQYLTFAHLGRELRRSENLDYESRLSQVYASGALVLPDIPRMQHPEEDRAYLETVDYLVNHAYQGGVLVIGGTVPISKQMRSGWPNQFERLLLESATVMENV